jgi:ethanolamine permease
VLAGGAVGIAAIYSDNLITIGGQPLTANIVTMSVIGAIVMYVMSMASLFRLRRTEPGLHRPFKAPLYPVVPAVALGLAVVALGTLVYFNATIFVLFVALLLAGWGCHRLSARLRKAADDGPLLTAPALPVGTLAD